MATDISFDDLIPSKEQDATTPSKEVDISFDDLVPKEPPKTTGLGTFTREAILASPATAVGVGVGSAVATATAPFGPYVAIPATIVAGGAAGFGANYLGEAGLNALEESSPLAKKYMSMLSVDKATRDAGRKQNEYSALAGQLASAGPFVSTKTASTALSRSLAERGFSGTIQAGVGAGQRAATGEDQDLGKTLLEFGGGALLPGKLTALGEKTVPPKFRPKEVPITPTQEGTTPQQKAEFLAKTKKIKAERDAVAPLVETALRNKETGEIERMGPKSSEQRKLETAATHEQGFVDERGNFHERLDAVEQAKRAGQIPKDYVPETPPDELPGLHSGDLRAVGDERFAITEKQQQVYDKKIAEDDFELLLDGSVYMPTNRPPYENAKKSEDGFWLSRDGKYTVYPIGGYGFKVVSLDTARFLEKYGIGNAHPNVEAIKIFEAVQEGKDPTVAHKELIKQINEFAKTPEDRAEGKATADNILQKAKEYFASTYQQTSSKKSPEIISSTGEIIIDRTTTSPRDVRDEKEFIDIATDIYEKHGDVEAVKFFDGWQEFKKTWAEPVREIENFVGTNINSKVANERIIHNNSADLKELAGKDTNLEQLSFDIDRGIPLEGKAKDVADKFRTLMDDLGKRALENGVIKGWHENYVARNVVSEGNAPKGAVEEFMRDIFGYGEKASGDGTKTTTKYGQERRLKTREDLVNHIQGINSWLESRGLDYRFKLKTDNLAEIYKDYALSVEKAIENKKLIDNIKQVRNVEGESLIKPITPESPLPYGWKQIDHPDLAGFAIHPDLVAPLKFVFDSGPGMTMQALGTVSQVVKRINVIGSFFHAKSLMEVLSSAKIPLWTPLKDAIVLPLVEKGVKTVTGKDLQLSAITKAVEQFKKGGLGGNVDKWIREDGLQLDTPEDEARGLLGSIGKFADTMIGKYGPKTRVLEKSMSTVEKYTLGIFDKYTWDYLHTGGKLMVADAYLEKARLQAAKEGKPFNESASRKEIAAFVNDSFGGLNWFDAARRTENEFAKRMAMAAYSPEGRRALQVVLFAPDWTISTIRAFTAALPKSLNPAKLQPVEGIKGMVNPTTKADYARLYQFKTALLYLTLLNVINNMTAGRDVWDNKDPTRIEWPDGTSMQAMKHAMEPYHWIAAPDKTLANKLGFIPKAAITTITNTEYASPNAPKITQPYITGISSIDSILGRGKAIAQSALPFQIQAAIGAPEGEGAKRALLGTMGVPVYGKTADQNKLARAEKELLEKENAWRYRDKEIKKGRMDWTPKHDKEKKALEKRRENLNKEAQ
jgi:hypothetical protein